MGVSTKFQMNLKQVLSRFQTLMVETSWVKAEAEGDQNSVLTLFKTGKGGIPSPISFAYLVTHQFNNRPAYGR